MSNIVSQDEYWNEEAVKLLRETYAKQLNEKQFKVFLEMAKAQGLNPFTKEIYAMIVSNRPVFITSINGFRKMAHSTGAYAGCRVEVEKAEDGKIKSARAVVKKVVQGMPCDFEAEVQFKEFNTGKNNWKSMPEHMIRKVAESHALRMAFPSLENVYEESEVGAIKSQTRDVERARDLNDRFAQIAAPEAPAHPDEIEVPFDSAETTEGMEIE